jgi:hypothetical protein
MEVGESSERNVGVAVASKGGRVVRSGRSVGVAVPGKGGRVVGAADATGGPVAGTDVLGPLQLAVTSTSAMHKQILTSHW